MAKLYPESRVEVTGLLARHYEFLLNLVTAGRYGHFIAKAIDDMKIKAGDRILDLGVGTGYNTKFMAKYLDPDGEILGLDIGEDAIEEFEKKFNVYDNINIERRRIDVKLPYRSEFDKVFISFVIHGLPQSARLDVVANARRALVEGGKFCILDYGDFQTSELPIYLREPFKLLECKYAFDYLKRDWAEILNQNKFCSLATYYYFGRFTRLLVGTKDRGKGNR